MITQKNNTIFKKDQKDNFNFEYIEEAGNKTNFLKTSLQSDFLIPKKEKINLHFNNNNDK